LGVDLNVRSRAIFAASGHIHPDIGDKVAIQSTGGGQQGMKMARGSRLSTAGIALLLADWAYASTLPQGNTVMEWNSAALQGIRDAKLGAPMVARALAIVHTCVYDAWAAYDEHVVGTQLQGALRLRKCGATSSKRYFSRS
jgi:hypothetical protein